MVQREEGACTKALRLERTWCAQDGQEKIGQACLRIEDGSLNEIHLAF